MTTVQTNAPETVLGGARTATKPDPSATSAKESAKTGAKIFVVDDTPANLEVITETLASQGYTVATALSGERALKRLQTYTPDLILLDIKMPGIDGFEACRQIQANSATQNIPIIFITAMSDIDYVVQGFSLGAVDYISKPFREPELLARVKTHLQLQSLNQRLEERVAERTAELQVALEDLHQSKLQLVQTEKMSALGNLVAGVAHEINNPVSFIHGNLTHADAYIADLLRLVNCYQTHYPTPHPAVADEIEAIDLDFLQTDLAKLLKSMALGTERIQNIIKSLRNFSRLDEAEVKQVDLHAGLDSTLLILQTRLRAQHWRPEIRVVKTYGDLPLLNCCAGQLNQVFMNLLSNAIDALEERDRSRTQAEIIQKPSTIQIQTRSLGGPTEGSASTPPAIEIKIVDNGPGMSQETRDRLFNPFFTTKPVGQGTGLGLSISHQIITEKHGGQITCQTGLDQGTTFTIWLPLRH